MLIIALLASCNTIKYVEDGEDLLHENTVVVNDKKSKDGDLYSYIIQRPNLSTLGVPLQLHLYNYGNLDFEKTFEEWSLSHPNKYKRYNNLFSEKQARLIYKYDKGFNNWFLKKGQAPVIYDSIKTEKTINSFKKYYFSNGFFEANVDFEEIQTSEKQKDVIYKITTRDQYYIDTIESKIPSPVLDSIYNNNIKDSYLKSGNPFVFNDFELEEERLFNLFRNSGVYHFNSNNIGFWTDSSKVTHYKDIVLKIPDRVITKGDSTYFVPYKIQKIKNINVYTDFDTANKDIKPNDSITYEGITYYAVNKLEYSPKHLSNSIFIKPGEIYKDENTVLTRNHLRKLQNFKSSIDIRYQENDDETLTANIYLIPIKKYALTFNLDATTSNIKPFGILGKFSFIDKNLFKGAEIFELSFQGSFLNVSKDASDASGFFNAWELITNASLTIPRIFFPIDTKSIIPNYMSPQTRIDLSFGMQKNIGLDRQTLTTGLGYNWRSSKRLGHTFDIYNLQYIENKNIDSYFIVYSSEYEKLNQTSENTGVPLPENEKENYESINDDYIKIILDPDNNYEETNPEDYDIVSDVNERQEILIEDVVVPVISYSINYNTKEDLKDNNFYFLTGRIVSSGTITAQLASKENEYGQKVLFGVPVAQYIKAEVEFKKYWDLSNNNIFVFRTFIGAALPYGNSSNIPFSRSYNAGGSNDIRAWRTFDLGPGGELNNLEFKVGTFKMVTNFEYRFKMMNNIYSALFVDIGNIWDITNSNLVSEAGKFTGFNSLKNSAIGSGFGIRYDFSFLVFRFDIGFKTYEPYLIDQNKWLTNYNFGNAVYNIGINYPF